MVSHWNCAIYSQWESRLKMEPKKALGWFLFIVGTLIFTLEQTYAYMSFKNVASQVIFAFICFILIALGIAFSETEEIPKQTALGVFSIFIVILLLNGILLIYDGASQIYAYSSTDYFYLLTVIFNFNLMFDPIAILFVALSIPLGICLWALVSNSEIKSSWSMLIYALIVFVLTYIFAYLNQINLFAI